MWLPHFVLPSGMWKTALAAAQNASISASHSPRISKIGETASNATLNELVSQVVIQKPIIGTQQKVLTSIVVSPEGAITRDPPFVIVVCPFSVGAL